MLFGCALPCRAARAVVAVPCRMRRHAVGPSTTVTLAAHSLRPRVGPLTSGRLFARRPACSRPLSWRRRRAVPPVPCHCCGSPVDHRPAVVSADHIRAGLLARSRLLLAPPPAACCPTPVTAARAVHAQCACHVACRSFRSSRPSASSVRLVHCLPSTAASPVRILGTSTPLAPSSGASRPTFSLLVPPHCRHALPCTRSFAGSVCSLACSWGAAGVAGVGQSAGGRHGAVVVFKIFRIRTPLAKPSPNFFKGFISLGCWFSRTPGDSGKSEHTIRLAVVDLPNRYVVTFSRKSIFTFKCPHRNQSCLAEPNFLHFNFVACFVLFCC